MTIKADLGRRIKAERNRKKISQSSFCGDEEKLTIRQLQRIEHGQSLPTLEKLEFIADRLDIKMSDLLEGRDIQLPDDYWEMKARIVKFPTYAEKERIQRKLDLINEVLVKYFDRLPEDELLFLDLSENILDRMHDKRIPNIEEIYDDAFEQVLKKKTFTFNDYLYLGYFLQKCRNEASYDRKIFKQIEQKLLQQELSSDEFYNIEFLVAVMDVAAVYAFHDDYKDIMPLLKKIHWIIEQAQLHTYKAGVLELEAKYYVKIAKDKDRAKKLYQQALKLGEILEDPAIIADIKMEMKNDGIE
ncbi:helix-turn-helix domain-containing protein [Streptococcus sobrinus]|uniref:helix-turn-helix domain-containing protein n=1 Tax=Streptococcus sobrinus TaxID=1310 RepID=UPI000D6E2A40|nr:XRE family transcriptional regulator [Streptococcus sobrinus]AWN17994.1 XRE family transcriptional regulator [Streptococcus sobrinus]